MPLTDIEEKELIELLEDQRIEDARNSFWEYCKLTNPDFYKSERKYLKKLCDTLQLFYERKLKLQDGRTCKKLMIGMPPRHGKTRTLTKYTAWVLGKDRKHKTIAAAYNDMLALDFSKFTRDEISQEKNETHEIVYSDIFSRTKIKHGSASMKQWAVKGSHFNYRGTGLCGTITGKGGNDLIIDDPIKDAETAFNEIALDKIWRWYTGTWLSRKEHCAGEIINHTPWSKRDLSGRILSSEDAKNWYVLLIPAVIDKKSKKMLCDEILSYDEYCDLQKTMDPLIFAANYDMKRLDKKGMMYTQIKTYRQLNVEEEGIEQKLYFADTAGKGEDSFCGIYGNLRNGLLYIFDIDFTQEDIDVTESVVAKKLIDNKIDIAYIENNSAGHSFAYHVEKELREDYNWYGINIQEFFQSKNKEARIFANRTAVMNRIIMPDDWQIRWPQFYNAIMTYSMIGKNKHDDGPDVLTIAVEYLENTLIQNIGINHNVT